MPDDDGDPQGLSKRSHSFRESLHPYPYLVLGPELHQRIDYEQRDSLFLRPLESALRKQSRRKALWTRDVELRCEGP